MHFSGQIKGHNSGRKYKNWTNDLIFPSPFSTLLFITFMFVFGNSQNSFSCTGDNTEKIWAHRFLSEPKTVAAGDLLGTVSLLEAQGDALVKR